MTAEEKARQLVDRFYKADRDLLLNVDCTGAMDELIAKECALICVDEILNISYFTHDPTEDDELYRNYWIHVKEAIEKL